MDSRIPMDEFERAFAAEDAPPRPTRNSRVRTAAIILMVVGVAGFLVDVVWVILSHHEPSGLRIFSAVCGAISVFCLRQFPVSKRVRG